jgi:glucose/arabinose dehydrogenase
MLSRFTSRFVAFLACGVGVACAQNMQLPPATPLGATSDFVANGFNPDYANYTTTASGLGDALFAISPPGEPQRLLVVQRDGNVRVIENGVLLGTSFFNISTLNVNAQVGTGSPLSADVAFHRLVPNSASTSSLVRLTAGATPQWAARNSEQGLLGMAFPPDYATSRRFYVYYTTWRDWFGGSGSQASPWQSNGSTVVARMFTDPTNPNRALHETPAGAPTTGVLPREERLITFAQPFQNHNGGYITFGPDGLLYIFTGDGGSGNDPNNDALELRSNQNPGSWLGKILRIDVSGATGYTVPASNPFIGQTQLGVSIRPEIYAYGLRNPWRSSFDRQTGDLIIGDVGQNAWEEVNFAPSPTRGAGWNFGWRGREGFVRTPAFANDAAAQGSLAGDPTVAASTYREPIFVYPRSGNFGGQSITGGIVYRGCAIPAYRGRYFFADFVNNNIWSVRIIGGRATDLRRHTGQWTGPNSAISQIASFAETASGEMLVVSLNGFVRQIVPQAGAPAFIPVDIANTDGVGNPDGVIDNGDFTLFFEAFFSTDPAVSAFADIANTDGETSLSCTGGPDGAVDNGDFSAFFAGFFGN